MSPVATARHAPERTCVGCRSTRPKPDLLRLVLPLDGTVAVDTAGRAPGRGAYLCADHPLDCLAVARRKRALTRAFRTTPERVDVEALAAALSRPEDQSADEVERVGGEAVGLRPAATRGASPPDDKEGEPSQR